MTIGPLPTQNLYFDTKKLDAAYASQNGMIHTSTYAHTPSTAVTDPPSAFSVDAMYGVRRRSRPAFIIIPNCPPTEPNAFMPKKFSDIHTGKP